MHQRRGFVLWSPKGPQPKDLWKSDKVGLRPSAARLINMIDRSSPAFPRVAALLRQMAQAGVDIDEHAIAIAVRLGEHHEQTAQAASPPPPALTVDDIATTAIVYYIRRGDLIKIGTTTRPKDRFVALRPDEILAFEPGSRSLEALRHRQFQHLREGISEYFRIETDLLEHAKRLRREHGDPPSSWQDALIPLQTAADRALPSSSELCNISEAARALGIKRVTAQNWVRRGKVASVTRDEQGNRLYFLDHFRELAEKSTAARADVQQPSGANGRTV